MPEFWRNTVFWRTIGADLAVFCIPLKRSKLRNHTFRWSAKGRVLGPRGILAFWRTTFEYPKILPENAEVNPWVVRQGVYMELWRRSSLGERSASGMCNRPRTTERQRTSLKARTVPQNTLRTSAYAARNEQGGSRRTLSARLAQLLRRLGRSYFQAT